LIPVILASDSTALTVFSGDKEAWPLYLSIGNIRSDIRNKPSNGAWVLIAYIPAAKWADPSEHHTTLKHRLFHQCLTHVLQPLIQTGLNGTTLMDSIGDQRLSFPRLAAYIADYPEQRLVNVVAGNNSPVTTAMRDNLDSPKRKPFRTRAWILDRIRRACQAVDPQNITEYLEVAKALGLNGVTKPFWEKLPGYQPELCIGPDLLHGFHRFWRDHVLKWIIALLGKAEIDSRLRVIQPVVGLRHFDKGISHLSQWSGREDRELQRVLLAAIDGHAKIDSNVMRALRAIQDFGYLIQYRSQSEETLGYLKRALSLFHSLLTTAFIRDGRRLGAKKPKKNAKKPPPKAHFKIPKLAGLHVYLYHIPEMGSSPQFSTEITETLHQTMAKAAYRATNRRDFVPQMCRFLDRTERIIHMNAFIDWAVLQRQNEQQQAHIDRFPVGGPAHQAILDAEVEIPVQRGDKLRRVWHTLTPHYRKVYLREACRQYNLSYTLITKCLCEFLDDAPHLDFRDLCVDIWRQFRIRIPTVQEDDKLAQAQTVQALPPSVPLPPHSAMPYGRCNSVLVHDNEHARTTGLLGMVSMCLCCQCSMTYTSILQDTASHRSRWYSGCLSHRTHPSSWSLSY
jgi:Plavaka transposase